MPDQGPVAFSADEATTLLRFLDYLRGSMARKLEGLSEEQVRERLVPSGTSLLWLAKHAAAAEALWIQHYLTDTIAYDDLPDEDELDDDTVQTVVALLEATGRRSRELLGPDPDLDQTSARDVRRHGHVTLRWLLVHLVEEISRHAGHADILRELIDGTTGR